MSAQITSTRMHRECGFPENLDPPVLAGLYRQSFLISNRDPGKRLCSPAPRALWRVMDTGAALRRRLV